MNETDQLLMQAALDGEIDAPALAAFERRLDVEPDLAAAYAKLRALKGALRAMPAQRAPDALRARIEALTAPPPRAQRANLSAHWRSLAATIAALGVGLAIGWNAAPQRTDVGRELLSDHLRGMISGRPVDVASTDQHTVKPWFAGKLSVAPIVPDLASRGYELEGGRIDVVAGAPAPTLVYRAAKHAVSVTRLPANGGPAAQLPSQRRIDGFSIVVWSDGGVDYAAASDASMAELEAFVAAFRSATADNKN